MHCDKCEREDCTVVTELIITEPIDKVYGYGDEEMLLRLGKVTLQVSAEPTRAFCKKCMCQLLRNALNDIEHGLENNVIGVPEDE